MIVAVTAVMVMHFDDVYAAHGENHCYVRSMQSAVMLCGVEAASTAVGGMSLLQKWSKLVKDDFKRGNSDRQHPDSPVHCAELKEEMAKLLSDSVAKILAWKTEQQQVLQQMHDQQDELNEEVSEIKKRLQTISDLIDCTVLQNHYLQLRMNDQMLDHVGIRRTELTTGSPGLDKHQQGLVNAAMERRRARAATNNQQYLYRQQQLCHNRQQRQLEQPPSHQLILPPISHLICQTTLRFQDK
jgi:hypothetical protein